MGITEAVMYADGLIKPKAKRRLSPARGSMRTWICERRSRAVSTILVEARSKKQAQAILDAGGGEGIDTDHYDVQRAKVIRADTASNLAASNNPRRPPPTIEEVRAQWKASEEWSFNHRFDGLKNPMR